MASFSFRAGNAGKLLRIPLYVAGRIANTLIPRREDWVFGCGAGIGDGALALWRIAAAEGHGAVWLVGSEREERDAAALGIPTLRKGGLRGWWATARAGVVIVTHGLGDVNRYASSGAFVVQLWHGIPLKCIGLDSPATVQSAVLPGFRPLQLLLGALYRSAAQRIRILPAASDRARGRLESAFGLGVEQVLVTGEPRVDVLSAGEPEQRRVTAIGLRDAAVGAVLEGARVILYAPTWRDGAADPAVPSPQEWDLIARLLDAQDAVLLVRSHPLGEGDYRPASPSDRIRPIGSSVVPDITPILPAVDVLVTDYSSLAYDVGLLGMPVLYLAPDPEAYSRSRGFYGRYEDVAGEDFHRDWTSTVEELERLLGDEAVFAARARRSSTLSAEMHAHRDGRNAERVYLAIRSRGVPGPKGAE
ncbi:CDP-glycerol glycerophosphotransferase [Microbacterium resistens]|uniref:CDP-glycerol glycerophosphotransferase n=1 Tax=Microbacterium resistens TaxID=156977 RepID=A0ABU1S785_9MICO|nr:CDP-glycerol glycerophosphotransferase family protein [Microbacterium resistens]MDR6865481.1 CDP-glycerol glycerophosphotransferase [Microbacterium resistens]